MPLFKRKPNLSIEECCRQFYDSEIFHSKIVAGEDFWSSYLDTTFQSITEVDQSFSSIEPVLFRNEMTALRMELFAFALGCSREFKTEKYTFPQSFFTRSFLEENGSLEIWDIMGEYNQAIAMSATMNASVRPTPGRIGRAQETSVNLSRWNLTQEWMKKSNIGDKDDKAITKEDEDQIECVARVANRLGADIKRGDGVVVKMLGARLADRLGCDVNLEPEALFRLAAVIFGFYKGAEEYLKSVDLEG